MMRSGIHPGAVVGVPEGSFAVAALIVLALPGLIYATVRRWLGGENPEDRNVGLAFARGLVFAVTLTATYLLVFEDWLFGGLSADAEDQISIADAREVGFLVLVLYVLVPLAISLLLHWREIKWISPAPHWPRVIPTSAYGYSSTQGPWDLAARENLNSWVRVRKKDGYWVGGWFGSGSHCSTFPEPHSLFIAKQFAMNRLGAFGAQVGDSGVWVAIEEGDVVYWEKPGRDDELRAKAGKR